MSLVVANLRASYGRIPILDGIDLALDDGEVVGILGHNGMGKSTFLKTLVGLVPATAGKIKYDDREITRLPTPARCRLGMGYVPQGREIFPGLSVRDNLRMGCVTRPSEEAAAIRDALDAFPRLVELLDRMGGALSGGEQQILALARCLCARPRLVLLDEPTEGIQPSIIEEIGDTLRQLVRARKLTLLLVEQNLEFIRALSERVLIMQKGKLTRELSAAHLQDADVVSEFIGIGG